MTSDETVYVRGQSMGVAGIVLHTDPDCSHLKKSNSVLEHPRDAYPDDQPVCEFCAGEFESAGGDNSGPWETLQEMAPDDLVTDGGQDIGQTADGRERTRVGHWMQDDCDVYVGRGRNGKRFGSAEIGERGWLGNPYRADEYGREESVRKFKRVFDRRLHNDEEFREAVGELSGRVLGCWCQRLDDIDPRCHAEIIATWADRIGHEIYTDTDRSERGDGP